MTRIQQIKSLPKAEIEQKLKQVKQTFIGMPIHQGKNDYRYAYFSLTDFCPAMDPELVEHMADLLVYAGNFAESDLIVSEADRGGGPLTHAVAVRTGRKYTLANWFPEGIPGQVVVKASVGFSGKGYICLNGITPGKKVIVVDDLLSSGGTAVALLQAIEKAGGIPIEAIFVAEKVGYGGREKLLTKFDIPIKSLVKFGMNGVMTRDIA